MVKFELAPGLPIATEAAAFGFVPLPIESEQQPEGTVPEGKRVLIVAADRRIVDVALRLAEEAKLRPVSITVAAHDPLALVEPRRGQRVARLHRTGEATDLLPLHGATLLLSRSFAAAPDPPPLL